jgi:hypothetical protein
MSRVCCRNLTTTPVCDATADEETCFTTYSGYMATGRCGDRPNPCNTGACCLDIPLDFCRDGDEYYALRGNCPTTVPFFKGKTCKDTCRTLSLGACCTRDNMSSPANCSPNMTFLDCAYIDPATRSTRTSFLGFSWNKTCAQATCKGFGACCSSARSYDGSIGWSCHSW